MFEAVVLRRSENGPPISAGELAEAMLFYQNVHLVMDSSSVTELASQIGLARLMSILKRPNVTATYCDEILATMSDGPSNARVHKFVAMTFARLPDGTKLTSGKQRLAELLTRRGHSGRDAKRFVDQFKSRVPFKKWSDDFYVPGGIPASATSTLQDSAFLQESVSLMLQDDGIQLSPSNLRFDIFQRNDGFIVDTNVDFYSVTRNRNQRDPSAGPITEAHYLVQILNANADMLLAARYSGDLYTSRLGSEIVRIRHSELLKRAGIHQSALQTFNTLLLNNFPPIRQIINSNTRTFDDFLKLLDKSDKFRHWLRGLNPDEDLIREYISSISADTWETSIPAKVVRYIVNLGGGALDGTGGALTGLADTFLLEKILRGWKPNHFIEKNLVPFVDSSVS